MAFQGNLRDFALSEILQLLGTQKKTGCLKLEWNEERAAFYVTDGRIVSTRQPGMAPDDPLLRFLLRIHRLSNEQYRGILTIQRESNRDLEDLLVNGRYVDAEELSVHIERQILGDLMRVTAWENGSYVFDPHIRWPSPPLVRLGVEGALIEVARRTDEENRFHKLFANPDQLVGVRDLPDADEHLSEEECELFGIIDGRHTLAEIVNAAPLSEYEAHEALHRMLEAGWIEIVGRRDPGIASTATAAPGAPQVGAADPRSQATLSRQVLTRELIVGLITIAVTVGLAFAARTLHPAATETRGPDVFAAAHERDLRFALDLYRLDRGEYPTRLEDLAADGWIAPHRLRDSGHALRYRPAPGRQQYELELASAR